MSKYWDKKATHLQVPYIRGIMAACGKHNLSTAIKTTHDSSAVTCKRCKEAVEEIKPMSTLQASIFLDDDPTELKHNVTFNED